MCKRPSPGLLISIMPVLIIMPLRYTFDLISGFKLVMPSIYDWMWEWMNEWISLGLLLDTKVEHDQINSVR